MPHWWRVGEPRNSQRCSLGKEVSHSIPGVFFGRMELEIETQSQLLVVGAFKHFLFSTRTLGKWSNLTSIFFKWVGSTTNESRHLEVFLLKLRDIGCWMNLHLWARKWFQVPGSKKVDAHLVKMKNGVILKCVVYIYLRNKKKGPWLFRVFVGDDILPSYEGIIS